jgi:hypothetical protein
MPDGKADPAQGLLGELVEAIADRVASRLAPHLSELVGGLPTNDGLWTARRVADQYDVRVRFIYQHADELGCIRLGGGARPRLRFDPHTVQQRWPQVRSRAPEVAPTHRKAGRRSKPEGRLNRSFELLEFDQES